jgi:hypothetical protein
VLCNREPQTSAACGRDRIRGMAPTAGHDALEILPPTTARWTGKHVVRPAARIIWGAQQGTAVLLSEAILSTITGLREDRRHQIMLQSAGDVDTGSLPKVCLFGLLRSLLERVLDNNRSELVRGNLYACLINYLHLVSADDWRGCGRLSGRYVWEAVNGAIGICARFEG